jgi:hypothetical protein
VYTAVGNPALVVAALKGVALGKIQPNYSEAEF